jgi:hypothetical protein
VLEHFAKPSKGNAMTNNKKISRAVLVRFAGLLGPDSIAAQALTMFDAIRSTGNHAQIVQTNEAFEVWRHGVREFPLPAQRHG